MPALFVVACLANLMLARLPGTADVNVWNAWAEGLQDTGFTTGYNAGAGHLLQPPLGTLMLYVTHQISPWIGLPAHLWPEAGWTGYAVSVWLFLVFGALLTLRITGSAGWAAAFQLAFALNALYGYFDLFGIPFFLLGLHTLARRRWNWACLCFLTAALIKWQFLVFAPFVVLYMLRDFAAVRPFPWKPYARALAPALGLLLLVLLVVGRGTLLSLSRGLAHDTLSGYALNAPWILTWAMHVRWPESYGPLDEGAIHVLRTQDTRVLALVRLLYGTSFLLVLWRQWRTTHSYENLLRAMLAGYLAYFLFNKGAHENHLVPAMALAGYFAWRTPRWRPAALTIAIAANLNMYFFYALNGADRGALRVAGGIDTSLLLSVAYVAALSLIYLQLCGLTGKSCGVAPAGGQGL